MIFIGGELFACSKACMCHQKTPHPAIYSQVYKEKGEVLSASRMDPAEILSGEGGWSPPQLLTQAFEMLAYFPEG